jgi:hypothetical protein
MTKRRDPDQEIHDPLFARLRALPSARLDDIMSSRTLASAEACLQPMGPQASPTRAPATSSGMSGWLLSAALAGWGMLYVWGAVGALARLFPTTVPAAVTLAAPPLRSDHGPVAVAWVRRLR